MIRKRYLVVIIILLFNFLPIAKANDGFFKQVEKRVVGVGPTYKIAIANALVEAVKQAYGLELISSEEMSAYKKENWYAKNGKEQSFLKLNDSSKSKIIEKTKGLIESYEVLEKKENKSFGSYEVIVKVILRKYTYGGSNPLNKKSLLVSDFGSKYSSYPVIDSNVSADEIQKLLKKHLESFLVQSRKFNILERDNNQVFKKEIELIMSGDTSPQEFLKLKKVLAADYIVIGDIKDFSISEKEESISIIGMKKKKFICKGEVDFKVLFLATRQIKWADTINIVKEIKIQTDLFEDLLSTGVSLLAKEIFEKMIFNIYPPKIIQINRNNKASLVLNLGGNTVKQGDCFQIFSLGDRLIDPYTGEFLGYEEIPVGKLQIAVVKPKYSYGMLIEGWAAPGMILRKCSFKQKNNNISGKKSKVKVLETGGVKLPFDK